MLTTKDIPKGQISKLTVTKNQRTKEEKKVIILSMKQPEGLAQLVVANVAGCLASFMLADTWFKSP